MALMDWPAIFVVVCCLITRSVGQNVTRTTCPNFQETNPCQCNVGANGITLDCQNIVDELELIPVFINNFQNEILYELIIRNSPIAYLITNVFGTTAFQKIVIKDSLISLIESTFFENSHPTLKYMEVKSINVDSDSLANLGNYRQLEVFQVEDIRGDTVANVFSKYLKEIRLMHYPIPFIDDYHTLGGLTGLERLYMNWNGLQSLLVAFIYTPDLNFLSLKGNNFASLDRYTFDYLSKVTYLDLSFNKLTPLSFGAGTFDTLTTLEHLDLSYNKFAELPSAELKGLPNLQFLNVSHNLISSLDSGTLSGNVNLNTIVLDFNNIEVLYDNSFSGMVEQNATIYLRSSNLVYLQTAAFGDTSSSQIHLENNQIPFLYEPLFRPLLEKDNVVYVGGNPYKCDCDFSWILDDSLFVSLLKGNCEDGTPFEDLDAAYFQGC